MIPSRVSASIKSMVDDVPGRDRDQYVGVPLGRPHRSLVLYEGKEFLRMPQVDVVDLSIALG